jgi:hypothetical protein
MSAYPRELIGESITPELEGLVRDIAARLLDGPSAAHATLREQLASARLSRITLTGAGLFADISLPAVVRTVVPADMIGGEVVLNVEGLDAPAGSLVKVRDGRLDFIEIYTYGDAGWPDQPRVLSFGESIPLPIAVAEQSER